MMNKIKLGIAGIVLLIAAFVAGRYTVPEKTVVKVEEKIVEKEVIKWKVKKEKEVNKDQETIIVETTYPDGTIKKETRIIDRGTVKISLGKEGSKETESSKEISKETSTSSEKNNWQVSLLAGSQKVSYNGLKSGDMDVFYGVQVQKRVLGPFHLGVFAFDNKTLGLSIGGSF